MRVLRPKDEALYAKLVRLAEGDSGIVLDILSNKDRPTLHLDFVIDQILKRVGEKRVKLASAST